MGATQSQNGVYRNANELTESAGRRLGGTARHFDYPDADGEDRGCAVRVDFDDGRPKAMRQGRCDDGTWTLRAMDAPRPSYRLHAVRETALDVPIVVTEGETCADRGAELGAVTTTSVGGSGAAHLTGWEWAEGRHIVIWHDNDDAGRKYRDDVARQLHEAGARTVAEVRIGDLNLPAGGDLVDWADARERDGATPEELADELRDLVDFADAIHPEEDPEGEPSPMLEILSLRDLAAAPNRPFVVDGLMHDDSLVAVVAPQKSFKTTVCDDLCVAVADGAEFLGQQTKGGLVIDCALEGALGKKARLQAHIGIRRFNDPSDPIHQRLFLLRTFSDITNTTGQDTLLRTIEHLCESTGEELVLLKLDTLARGMSMCGLDENSTQDMGAFVGGLDRIRQRFPSLQLVVHHTGKAGLVERGSTALPGAADLMMGVQKEDNFTGKLWVREARDIEVPSPWRVRFASVVVGEHKNGRHITALRVDSAESVAKEASPEKPEKRRTRDALLDLATEAGADGFSFTEGKAAASKANATVSEALAKLSQHDLEAFTTDRGEKRWRRKETT